MDKCCCNTKSRLIYSCSGAANTGKIVNKISNKIKKDLPLKAEQENNPEGDKNSKTYHLRLSKRIILKVIKIQDVPAVLVENKNKIRCERILTK